MTETISVPDAPRDPAEAPIGEYEISDEEFLAVLDDLAKNLGLDNSGRPPQTE